MSTEESADRYRDIAKRLEHLFEGRVVGARAGREYNGNDRAIDLALIELLAVELEDEGRRPGAFLEHPPHLPDSEPEMRALMNSASKGDRVLRQDLLDWADVNRSVAEKSARDLQTLIEACHLCDRLIFDHPGSEDEQTVVYQWRKWIGDYVRAVFKIEPDSAPRDATMPAWCVSKMSEGNPAPSWLTHRKARKRFEEKPAEDGPRLNPFAPRARRVADEDWNEGGESDG